MAQEPVKIGLANCLKQRAIEEGKLKFHSMEIDVFEVSVQLLTLIVVEKEEKDVSSRIVSLKAHQFLAHAAANNFHRIIKHARAKQFRRHLCSFGFYELIDN